MEGGLLPPEVFKVREADLGIVGNELGPHIRVFLCYPSIPEFYHVPTECFCSYFLSEILHFFFLKLTFLLAFLSLRQLDSSF